MKSVMGTPSVPPRLVESSVERDLFGHPNGRDDALQPLGFVVGLGEAAPGPTVGGGYLRVSGNSAGGDERHQEHPRG